MADFLSTDGLRLQIEQVIKGAQKFLIIASPFIQISERYQRYLSAASQKGVNIRVIYGKDNYKTAEAKEKQAKELAFLDTLENCKTLHIETLHAKCFLNEESVVISSMNLYTYSENNNIEMGVLLNRRKDRDAYKDALTEVSSFISHYLKEDTILAPDEKEVRIGFCIRCATEIDYNAHAPFCLECFRNAGSYDLIPYKKEKFCHACGDPFKTSFSHPVSDGCTTKKTKKVLQSKF